MGEICDWLTSSETEVRCVEALVLGVGGIFPVGDTLPMNHDWGRIHQDCAHQISIVKTYRHPTTISAFFLYSLWDEKLRYEPRKT